MPGGGEILRIIKKKERGYRFFSEKYDLSGSYAGKEGISIGVLLLYILVQEKDFQFAELTAEAEGEIGEERNIFHVDPCDEFHVFRNVEGLSDTFQQQKLVIWELKGIYQNVDVVITGRTYGTVLSVRTPLNSKINMIPLMSAAESATYDYCDYDDELITRLKVKYHLNQKMAIQTIVGLQKHPDIWEEFLNGLQSTPFLFPKEGAVSVNGYTAEMLFKNYPLSELGAYHYLIYLRNDPVSARNDLKQGLPRR